LSDSGRQQLEQWTHLDRIMYNHVMTDYVHTMWTNFPSSATAVE